MTRPTFRFIKLSVNLALIGGIVMMILVYCKVILAYEGQISDRKLATNASKMARRIKLKPLPLHERNISLQKFIKHYGIQGYSSKMNDRTIFKPLPFHGRCIPHQEVIKRYGIPGLCNDSQLILPCVKPYKHYLDDPSVLSACGVTNSSAEIQLRKIVIKHNTDDQAKCFDKRGIVVSNSKLPVSPIIDTPNLVPNVVHYVSLGCARIFTFANYISVLSVNKFVQPERIYFHGDCLPKGEWWNKTVNSIQNIFFRQCMRTKRIQGIPPRYIEHETDIIRVQVLLDEGGIYLDTDVIILAPLTGLKRYAVTQGLENPSRSSGNPGSSFILAQPKAPYMCLWLHVYREYRGKSWGKYAIEEPGKIARAHPELVHLEQTSFFRPNYGELPKIFRGFYDWSKNYIIHLWNHVSKTKYKLPKHPGEIPKPEDVKCTLHEIFRYIYFGDKSIHAKKK